MIKSISMKNCATYDEVGASLMDCKKINFIYGANGSGKSTISNFLRNGLDSKYKDCTLEWDKEIEEDILVYNRAFKEANFNRSTIDGVFTIGQATIDEQKELEKQKKELGLRKEEFGKALEVLKKKEEEKKQKEKAFKESVWDSVFKKYERDFVEAFTGFRNSKERLFYESQKRYSALKDHNHNLDDLLQRAKTLFGNRPNACSLISVDSSEYINEIEKIECDELWKEVIVGSEDVPIGTLIHRLHSNAWVRTGQEFIEEGSDVCPFCQQHTITKDFRGQIERFFDETYKNKVKKIDKLKDKYNICIQMLERELRKITEDEQGNEVGKIDVELLEAKKQLLAQVFQNNCRYIEEKNKNPEKKIEFEKHDDVFQDIIVMVQNANKSIQEHNELVRTFNASKEKLVDDIWEYILNEQKSIFIQANKDLEAIEKAIKGVQQKINGLNTTIKQLEERVEALGKNITSVQPTVNEINRLLKAYGFNNFLIAPSSEKEHSYQIQREDGSLATNTLSEGEETFITFLYFMQLRKGSIDPSKISNKKVLVLDDPICSLDSTILYILSAMVKELANDIKSGNSDVSQLFVLTHNVFFHKEASFLDGRPNNKNGEVYYWIISKNNLNYSWNNI